MKTVPDKKKKAAGTTKENQMWCMANNPSPNGTRKNPKILLAKE